MSVTRSRLGVLLPAFFLPLIVSCAQERQTAVLFFGQGGTRVALSARSEAGASGRLAASGALRYSLADELRLPERAAIELEYDVAGGDLDFFFASDAGEEWALPVDAERLAVSADDRTIRYRIPLSGPSLSRFSIAARKRAQSGPVRAASVFSLRSLSLVPRAYGFALSDSVLFLSPFVYGEHDGKILRVAIDPPEGSLPSGPNGLRLIASSERTIVEAAGTEYECAARSGDADAASFSFPAGLFAVPLSSASCAAAELPRAFLLQQGERPAFPDEPVAADPGIVLDYSRDAWRDPRYEFFRWERFPSVLIYDTADYSVQDRLFKRLAFFVEKAGYRGRLAEDADIAALHAWNAHDYRAEDLALFFETARATGFALNAEERELERSLLSVGTIRKNPTDGTITAGVGAVVSFSRESDGYLRRLFITHEAWHGLFFIDQDFRAFAQKRYEGLGTEARAFFHAYLDSRRYDTADAYLMKNELMAYCLQQGVRYAEKYFGETLPVRLEKDTVRRKALPPRDERAVLPYPTLAAAFLEEARSFDEYVAGRYGLRAGNVASVYQMSRTAAAR